MNTEVQTKCVRLISKRNVFSLTALLPVFIVLRIKGIGTGKVLAEAVSRTDNIGYFVTDRYGSWKSAPHVAAPSR